MIIKYPSTLTLITTHMCTSACMGCCYECSPKQSKKMSFSQMKEYVDDVRINVPSIKTIVFTGGECTLLNDDLFDIIQYSSKLGFITRVITNGYWAKNMQSAYKFIERFIESGLNEINFSTGDNHQQFVEFNSILNAIELLVKTNISSIVVSVESGLEHKFKTIDILNNERFVGLGKDKNRVILIESPWIYFNNLSLKNCVDRSNEFKESTIFYKGCDNVFSSININPHGQLLACCGFAAEYSSVLKLGMYSSNNISKLYITQFNDFFKIWLYAKGPYAINDFVRKHNYDKNSHPCLTCFKLLLNKKYVEEILYKVDTNLLKNVILDYNLKINLYETKN